MNVLSLIGRKTELFGPDIAAYDSLLGDIVKESRFLVLRRRFNWPSGYA